jgi:hypothetical protein
MLTVFEKIPDQFVQAYDAQFQTWAREFRTRGSRCCVEFARPPGSPVLLDVEGRAVKRGAWLTAEIDKSRPQQPKIVIRPADEFAEDLIARHTKEMQAVWFS